MQSQAQCEEIGDGEKEVEWGTDWNDPNSLLAPI